MPSKELQAWMEKWCGASLEACAQCSPGGRPDCPALKEMPEIFGPSILRDSAVWYGKGIEAGVKSGQKHANDLLASLAARVEALEKHRHRYEANVRPPEDLTGCPVAEDGSRA